MFNATFSIEENYWWKIQQNLNLIDPKIRTYSGQVYVGSTQLSLWTTIIGEKIENILILAFKFDRFISLYPV